MITINKESNDESTQLEENYKDDRESQSVLFLECLGQITFVNKEIETIFIYTCIIIYVYTSDLNWLTNLQSYD